MHSPVLALHSLFFDGSMFDDLARRTGRRVHAPDHRGQGARTDDPGETSVDALAQDAAQVIEAIGEPVHVVGSSMGAYVAMALGSRRPELVRSVVLSAATADAERRPEVFADLVAELRAKGPATIVDRLCTTMFGDPFLENGGEVLEHWRERFASRVRVADAAEKVFARRPLWDDVEKIFCPVLLMAGAHDRAKSPADMSAIADRIGCPDPVVFAESGHTPFVEEPERVAAVLGPWWDRIDTERKP